MRHWQTLRAERQLFLEYYDDDNFPGFWSESFQQRVSMAFARICLDAEDLAKMQIRKTLKIAKMATAHLRWKEDIPSLIPFRPLEPSIETDFLWRFDLTACEFLECRMSSELPKVLKMFSVIPIDREELLRLIRFPEEKRSWTSKV